MLSLIKKILVSLTIFMPTFVSADQFKLYLDNTHTKHIMVEQQDCSVHKTEDGQITLGFKVGNFLLSMGPEITFGKKTGIDWDHTVQGLVARYQELCTRFNTGSISKQEYEERLAKIEGIENDAYELYQKSLDKKNQRRQDVFDELDRDTKKFEAIKNSHDEITRRLELD